MRATITVAALVGASACADGAEVSRERQAASPPALGACIEADGAMQPLGSAEVEGEVEEVGLGMPTPASTGGCPFGGTLQLGAPGLGDAPLLAQVSWARVRDATNRSVVLSALAEGFAFPLRPGDRVRARLDLRSVGFGGDVASFEARTADGSLVFWLGFATRLAELEPPSEVALSAGDVEAELEDECVESYRLRALNVDVDGSTVAVPSGARIDVGPWSVVNAGLQEQTGDAVCADAIRDQLRVALWPRTAQVRDSGGIGGPCYAHLPIEQAEGKPQYLCLPDATLSRQCASSSPCPAGSRCVEGLCRRPASVD